jgi:hexosaminidase
MSNSRILAALFAVGFWGHLTPLVNAATEVASAPEGSAVDLRLIPYPQKVHIVGRYWRPEGEFVVRAAGPKGIRVAAESVAEALKTATQAKVSTEVRESDDVSLFELGIWLDRPAVTSIMHPIPAASPESYVLLVDSSGWANVWANDVAGLRHGARTLQQLIRSNMRDGAIPCVQIEDWPALRYRGFSDDITRGPSPKLETLRGEVELSAMLKMNLFTYYMEHQFAFEKHPEIGPKDGSLQPAELKELVGYARERGVEIIGNQQSFGHFGAILQRPQYQALRETPDILNPTNEGTYRLLDDLYSEEAPLTDCEFFNVCCDETQGLGTGPSKPLADKIGEAGVYVQHINKIHDLLRTKYKKRMMMWGDIILLHPDHLKDIPKDTVMLSWGYDPLPTFEPAIAPFAKAGFEFFVCPGVNCWSRIVPDFAAATTNIQNYVRDGVRLGALGMINTTWDDDGENFDAYNWHGVAWGAECAWTGSKTDSKDFNHRVGGVLFGEPGDHFGRAVEELAKVHRLPGYGGMFDGAFWNTEWPKDEQAAKANAGELLRISESALEHLRAARAEAKFKAEVLNYYIFGAMRLKSLADRQLVLLGAAEAYRAAATADSAACDAAIGRIAADVQRSADDAKQCKAKYVELWNRENRPYALDRVAARFDGLLKYHDAIVAKLKSAQSAAQKGETLPAATNVGLGR